MDMAAVVDDLLEITVIGSFSRIGHGRAPQAVRLDDAASRRAGGADRPPHGRDVRARARGRRRAGDARGARDPGRPRRGEAARRSATSSSSPTARTASRWSSSTWRRSPRFARRSSTIVATESRLDVLIDNAGAIFPTRQVTADGIEATLATMVVGPFALVAGLLPLLEATPGARVIAVTSGGQYAQRLHLDDLQSASEPWDGTRAYARAKRAQVSLIREWARRVARRDVSFVAMHPGWADTPGLAAALPGFHRVMGPLLRTPARGHRHDGLAGRRRTGSRPHGPAPAGSSRPPVRPHPVDARLAGRSPAAVGRRRPVSPGSPTRVPRPP